MCSLIVWEGIAREEADTAYEVIRDRVGKFGRITNRRCEANAPKTCACQGLNQEKNGASFTFGCSWSMYFKGCKYARSADPDAVRKFKMDEQKAREYVNVQTTGLENELEQVLGKMATGLSHTFKTVTPDCYKNMTACSELARDCRIGFNKNEFGDPKPSERPFSGVTCVTDFCAHSHRDTTNMVGGCTAVVTLTKPENRVPGAKVDDEQFHVLPHYAPDLTDEFGNRFEMKQRMEDGALEVLDKFERVTAVRDKPAKACKRGHPKADMKAFLDNNWRNKKGGKAVFTQNMEGPRPRGSPAKGQPVKTEQAQSTQPIQPQQQLQHVEQLQQQQQELQFQQRQLQLQQQQLQQQQQHHMQMQQQQMLYTGYPVFNPNLNHTAYSAPSGQLLLAQPPVMTQAPIIYPNAQYAQFGNIPQTDGAADDGDVYNFAPGDEQTSSAATSGANGNQQNLRDIRIYRTSETTTIDIRHQKVKIDVRSPPSGTELVPKFPTAGPPESNSGLATAATSTQQPLPAVPPLMRLPPTQPIRYEYLYNCQICSMRNISKLI